MRLSFDRTSDPEKWVANGEFDFHFPLNKFIPKRIQSEIDAQKRQTQKFTITNEETNVVLFDQEKHLAVYPDAQLAIPEKTFDLLGLFLDLQTINLDSLPQERPVHFFNRKNYQTVITKLANAQVRGRKGKFQHLLLTVIRPGEANLEIHFWLTPDEKQTPVRIELEISLGGVIRLPITAELSTKDP